MRSTLTLLLNARATTLSSRITGLALAMGLAATTQAQTIVTNYINFSDFTGSNAVELSTQEVQGMPAGITATWGWQFFLMNDFGAFAPPSGSVEGIDCRGSSVVTFSSPVVIWSMNAVRMQWGSTLRMVGKLGGNIAWVFDNSGSQYTWQTITNGAWQPIDTLEFDCEDWNTRYTDIYISDGNGITPPPPPLITFFRVTPNVQWRVPGAPVQLAWQTDPSATLTINNGIGDVTGVTVNGSGSVSISPTNTTTYTLTSQNGTNVATAQVTVTGSILPATSGFLTFENIDPSQPFPATYNWNAPVDVFMNWNGWGATGNSVGAPQTPVDVFPLQWPLSSTNSLGLTNNAVLTFTDSSATPLPVMLNSLAVSLQQLSWATNPPPAGWGRFVLEGKLAGVVQWTWDEVAEGHDWENIVTKGAGIPIDELDVSGQWYQMDNFSLSTVNFPVPHLTSPAAQGGQFQFAWDSVTDWANYIVMKNTGFTPNGWWRVGALNNTATGSTNIYSEPLGSPGFFRVLRVP